MEIEIKVKLQNSAHLLALLEKEGTRVYVNTQIDSYYNPPHKNFVSSTPVVEWLRLRDSDGKYSINYKNWHVESNGTSNYCDEYETKLENIDSMRSILDMLNFTDLITVNKKRSVWNYNDYEVSIDEVEELGDFVEIEYKGSETNPDPKKITDEMMAFLQALDCGNIERDFKGYPYLLLEKHGLLKN